MKSKVRGVGNMKRKSKYRVNRMRKRRLAREKERERCKHGNKQMTCDLCIKENERVFRGFLAVLVLGIALVVVIIIG